MIRKSGYIFLFITMFSAAGIAQTGSSFYRIENDTGELTKKVNVWGYVKNPGRYEVPLSTNLVQMVAIAGGPRDHALMDEVKVYASKENGPSNGREVNLDEPDKIRDQDLLLLNEDTIIIDHSAAVTVGEIFGYIGAPLAVVTSLFIIYDRLKR